MSNRHVVFLDTTVFADHQFGGLEVREHLDGLLTANEARSSSYVREQFRATFLRAAVIVYNDLFETRDPHKTRRNTDCLPFFQAGEGVKARMILETLLDQQVVDCDDMLATLERLIEWEAMAAFDELATLTNETKCCRCHDAPKRDENGIFRFKVQCLVTEHRPCDIEKFWEPRLNSLRVLAENQKEPPKSARKAADEHCNDGKPPRGMRCYVHLSDAVIVAESSPGASLVSSNGRDFDPLVKAFAGGRTLTTYSPGKIRNSGRKGTTTAVSADEE